MQTLSNFISGIQFENVTVYADETDPAGVATLVHDQAETTITPATAPCEISGLVWTDTEVLTVSNPAVPRLPVAFRTYILVTLKEVVTVAAASLEQALRSIPDEVLDVHISNGQPVRNMTRRPRKVQS